MKNKTAVLKQTARSYHIYRKKSTEGIEMKRWGKATGRTLLTALLAFAAALLAFFGVMFGIMPKDMYEVRAAGGEPVAIKAELQAGKDIISGMTMQEVGAILKVSTVDADGTTVAEVPYDETGTAGFTVSGNTTVSSGLSKEETFTVTYGELSCAVSFTVQVNRIKSIKILDFTYSETIYSYTMPYSMPDFMKVEGTYYDGSTTTLSSNSLSVPENFMPDAGYNGTDASYEKEMIVRYSGTANRESYTVETTYNVTVTAATPIAVSLQASQSIMSQGVTAFSTFAQYLNEFTITVMYSGGSAVTTRYSGVVYGDASSSAVPDAKGFVYDKGSGTVQVSYTEAGTTVHSSFTWVRVVRIAAEIGSINSLTYQYEENLEADSVTGTEQTVVPMGFDPQIMKITAIEKDDPERGEIAPSFTDESAIVTDAGSYTLTVTLTNDAYFWQGLDNESDRDITVKFSVLRAKLPSFAVDFSGENILEGDGTSSSAPYKWNHGEEAPAVIISGNYGNGELTYRYSSGSSVMPSARGNYTLSVDVAQSDNFEAATSNTVYFQIGQRELKLPSFTNAVYNRQAQFASDFLAEGSELWATYEKYCDITAAGGALSLTDKGTLEITFTIKADQENNAKWAGREETVYKASFEVIPLKIVKPTLTNTTYVYNTKTQTWTLSDYNAVVAGQTGVSGTFVNALALTQGSGSSAFTKIDSASGTLTAMNAGSYSVTVALNNENLTWEDGGRDPFVLSMTIQKNGIAIPTLPDGTYTYKADANNSVTLSGFDAALMGIQDITAQEGKLIDIANGILTGKNAGTYTVRITLNDSANYCWTTDGGSDVSAKEISWTIGSLAIEVPTAETPLTYNAAEQTYSFGNTTQDAHLAPYSVTGDKGTNAGQYTATFTLTVNDMGVTNYIWSNNSDGESAPAKVS